jgi:hypothetical protein
MPRCPRSFPGVRHPLYKLAVRDSHTCVRVFVEILPLPADRSTGRGRGRGRHRDVGVGVGAVEVGGRHRSSCGRSCLVRPVMMAPEKTAAKPGSLPPALGTARLGCPCRRAGTRQCVLTPAGPTRQADRQICLCLP